MTAADQSRIRDYLKNFGGIDSVIGNRKNRESAIERPHAEGFETESARLELNAAESALEKLATGQILNPDEEYLVEAIILPDERPAIDIKNGKFEITHHLWTHLGTDAGLRSNIETAIASVGRVELPDHPRYPYGGTGFVVGDGLLMTNRHVAELFARGLGTQGLYFIDGVQCALDLEREIGSKAAKLLKVRSVVMIHPYWDMALLKVDGLNRSPLVLLADEQNPGRDITVIGYPGFDPRNDADVQNTVFRKVFNVKRLQPGKLGQRREVVDNWRKRVSAITHDSSTLGGNSGSAVIDVKSGKVVALHFGGRYLDANFAVPAFELARDERVLQSGVKFLGKPPSGTPDWLQSWNLVDRTSRSGQERQTPSQPSTPPSTVITTTTNNGITLTIPLEISIRLGETATRSDAAPTSNPVSTEAMVEPHHEEDYSNRRGFDTHFLGREVALPKLTNDKVAARLTGEDGYVIPYHNFSIVMHADRRLALLTAVNLTADEKLKEPEPGYDYSRRGLGGLGKNDRESWFIDPRLELKNQLSDRFFTRDRGAFDKGHLVRREDAAWGASYKAVRAANGDTFHVTNCSPQVAGFNQAGKGEDNWGDLENLIFAQANVERLILFSGPVLANNDPIFIGVDSDNNPLRIQIPQSYWKIIVADSQGELQAFAFSLEQDLSDVDIEFSVPETWRRKMVPLTTIEAATKLRFSKAVRTADQFGEASAEKLAATANLEIGE